VYLRVVGIPRVKRKRHNEARLRAILWEERGITRRV